MEEGSRVRSTSWRAGGGPQTAKGAAAEVSKQERQ